MSNDDGTHVPSRREHAEPSCAHVWKREANAEWTAEPLTDGVLLRQCTLEPLSPTQPAEDAVSAGAVILSAGPDRWALLTRDPNVRVNGRAPAAGFAEMHDRDEIYADGARFFFSTERRAVVNTFCGDEPLKCPRCFKSIGLGEPAAQCVSCRAWMHAGVRPCFTYAECPICGHRTSLDGGFEWSPDVLDGCVS